MGYIDKRTKGAQNNNLLLKVAFKCCHCCLWCLDKTLKFISSYGLVFVALLGSNFCTGCVQTFKFVVKNPAQTAMNHLVVRLLSTLSLVAIPAACAFTTFYYLTNNQPTRPNPMYPTMFVALISMVITYSSMLVFECAVTTLFVCGFRDMDMFQGKFMSDSMRSAFNLKKGAGTGSARDADTLQTV